MLGATLAIPFIISGPMCFENNTLAISEVLSTIYFVSGFVTLLQTLFGVRWDTGLQYWINSLIIWLVRDAKDLLQNKICQQEDNHLMRTSERLNCSWVKRLNFRNTGGQATNIANRQLSPLSFRFTQSITLNADAKRWTSSLILASVDLKSYDR